MIFGSDSTLLTVSISSCKMCKYQIMVEWFHPCVFVFLCFVGTCFLRLQNSHSLGFSTHVEFTLLEICTLCTSLLIMWRGTGLLCAAFLTNAVDPADGSTRSVMPITKKVM